MFSRPLLSFASLSLVLSVSTSASASNLEASCTLKENSTQVEPLNASPDDVKESRYLKQVKKVNDADVNKKFRIASLSKLLTTHWALATLGPEYRFKTKIYVTPSASGANVTTCNVHFEGDMDPYMGSEILNQVAKDLKAKLKEKKCASIDTLSLDENMMINLNVMKHQHDHGYGWTNPQSLTSPSTNLAGFTSFAKSSGLSTKATKIGPISKDKYQEYLKSIPYSVYSFESRPFYMIAKDYNKFSYNYPPNVIFQKLGGADAYAKFIDGQLKLESDEVIMYNGSGYPITTESSKLYNMVSCTAIVKVLQDMDKILDNYKGSRSFQMADILAVGGHDPRRDDPKARGPFNDEETYSTFKSIYSGSQYTNTLVAKTGTADGAITFGGVLSTSDGDLYFAVLTDGSGSARNMTRELVQTALVQKNKTQKFQYKQVGDMSPYDDQAKLVDETPKLDSTLK